MEHTTSWKRNISVFLSSQIISLLGSSLVQYAITWHITRTTQSGLYATLSIVCGFLPTFFLAPFAGVWADRYDRKKLIILSDASIALSTLVLALLFLGGYQNIGLLLAASAIRSLGSAIQGPAVSAILPQMVPSQHLTRVNGINQSAQSLLMLVSPMLAALLLDLPVSQPLVFIFFIDVVTAFLAIMVLLLFLKLPKLNRPETQNANSYFHDMKEGLAYIKSLPFLKDFFAFCILFFLMMAPASFLTQLQVVRSFGPEYWRLSAIEMAFSVGMVMGGLLISSWQGFKNRLHTMVFSGVVLGICTFMLGVPMSFFLYCVFMGLLGVTMPVFNTPAMVVLQQRVAPQMMGRVFGVMTMLSSSLMPLGMLIYGPLADVIRIEWLLLVTGGILVPCSLLMLRSKSLLAAGKPLTAEEEAQAAPPMA